MATLKEFERIAQDANTVPDILAAAVLGNASHATVVCVRCGKNFPAQRADISRYFRSGWPICCGETATLATKGRVTT